MSHDAELHAFWTELERVGKVLGRAGPDEICCEGLTIRQCAILRTLAGGEGARLSALAAAAGITQSALTRAIEKLESRNLVARVRGSGDDGRSATVELTPIGRRLRRRLDLLMLERTRAIVSAVPEQHRASVLTGLRILNEAMLQAPCCGLNQPVSRSSERRGRLYSESLPLVADGQAITGGSGRPLRSGRLQAVSHLARDTAAAPNRTPASRGRRTTARFRGD